jgi:predicted aspartyl protease
MVFHGSTTLQSRLRCGLALCVVALAPLWGGAAEARFFVDAAINGQPVRLAFDTGTSGVVLFSRTAARLGLAFTNAAPQVRLAPGLVAVGWTEACGLQIAGNAASNCLAVVDIPAMLPLGVDGIVGWPNISNNVMRMDATHGTLTWLPQVPAYATNWTRLKLRAGSDVLCLEVPQSGGAPFIVFVDTGCEDGAKLAPELWRAWRAAHAQQPLTFNAYYTPSVGLVVAEVGWADRLAIGPVLVTGIPVEVADPGDLARGLITLGMAALKRLDIIVDGKKGVAYLHAKTTPPTAVGHNRLGAVFTPEDLQHADLLAHVMEGSPAWLAGIRDGDMLLRIGSLDVTKWRTDPAVMPMSRFWSRPAGTKHQLTLRRGAQEYRVAVVLRHILGPEPGPADAR